MLRKRMLMLSLTISVFFTTQGFCGDWPQWRGPNRDGVWSEDGVMSKFEGGRLAVRWRAEVSGGYSGPTVASGRVYVTDRSTAPAAIERVLCFDAATGAEIWSYSYDCEYVKVGYRAGPRASVTINETRAYSLGTMGHLFCFDAAKGKVLWSKDLNAEYKIRMPHWGIAASPLIEKDLVIVQIGGANKACLVAFDKVTGEEKWRALNDRVSYSAPIVIDQAGKRVLVCWTGDNLAGLDALTGEVYWKHAFTPSRMVIGIATPVLKDNYIFVSSFYDGSLLVKIDPEKLSAEKVWRRKGPSEKETDSLHCCISTPVLLGKHIYGVDSFGEFRCLDLLTGDRIWEDLSAVPKARWSNIHMVRNGGKIWMFNERGELIICTLSPQGLSEISRARLIDPTEGQLKQRGGVCWSHPAYAYKHIYIRNDKELICADLSAKD